MAHSKGHNTFYNEINAIARFHIYVVVKYEGSKDNK